MVSKISNATWRLDIYLSIASSQKVFAFIVSRAWDYLTQKGTTKAYLCVVSFTRAFTTETIFSLFWRVYGNHHAKAGSSEMPWEVENLATSIGLDYSVTNRGIHCLLSYFQATSKFHPTVYFCLRRWPNLVMIY